MLVIYNTLITVIFYFCAGSLFTNLKYDKTNKICIIIIHGAIFLSFIALVLNFFFPLSSNLNTFVFFLIITLFIILKIKNLKKNLIVNILYISFLGSIIIYLAESNRPDSGIYHYPLISLINNEKLIIGLTNIHSHYGLGSIIQYLQALSNNIFTNTNGMLLPLSIIPATIYLYFYFEILHSIKKIHSDFYVIFNFFCLVFFTYKMNRYGQYGNDYLPHFLVFFYISLILKYKKFFSVDLSLFYSTFIFLNKVFFIYLYLLTLYLFLIKKTFYFKINKTKTFLIIFMIAWFSKNLLNSGCLIWPVKYSCITSLNWFNKDLNSTQFVSHLYTVASAWNKGFPDQRIINNYHEYLENFNWITTWAKVNGVKLVKIYFPFILFVYFLLNIFYKFSSNKYNTKKNLSCKNIFLLLAVFLISDILWFLSAPAYRFGLSNLVVTILLISIYFTKNREFYKSRYGLVVKLTHFCLFIFIVINLIKLKNLNKDYYNYPFPRYNSFSFENKLNPSDYVSKNINNYNIYIPQNTLCLYSKPICTNEPLHKNLFIDKKLSYKVIYLKND